MPTLPLARAHRVPAPSAEPGYFPSFDMVPHPVPFNLYDPWGVQKNKTPEQLERGRLIEINNGRLAMIGLFGFLSETKVPGAVPLLKGVGLPAYDGEVMAPFVKNIFSYAAMSS